MMVPVVKKPGISTAVDKSQKYLLGLDAGNTVIKAVLFDLTGRQIAIHVLDGQSSSPELGHVELDMDELWANAQRAIQGCITEAGISPDQIAGVGCAGHGNGLYLLDREGIAFLGIQSLDTRASVVAEQLSGPSQGRDFHAICLQKPWPSQTPTLLSWVKQYQTEIF